MAGWVRPEFFTGRLKWARAMEGEVIIQDGRGLYGCLVNRRLKGSFKSIRLLNDSHGEVSTQIKSKIERSRTVPRVDGSYKPLQNRSEMKELVGSLSRCVNQGTPIDAYDYLDVLRECSKHKDLESVKQVHDCIKKSGLEDHPYVGSSLLKCYVGCGKLHDAKELFNTNLNKTIVSWNIIIGGYAEHGQAEDAIDLYRQMRNEGGQPNAITYLSALKACTTSTALQWGMDIHADITHDGFEADVSVGTALVNMYAKCGSIEDSRAVFDRMQRRDVVSWTTMIGGLAEHGYGLEAFSLFLQMQREGFRPNAITYVSILNPCASTGALEWVKEVHGHAMKAGMDVNLRVGNALVRMYAKIGCIADARQVFDKMPDQDVVSWTVMIGGLAEHGHGREALQLFKEMKVKGIEPDRQIFTEVLSACSHAGLVDEGRFQFISMKRDFGIKPDVEHHNCLVDMLGRAGHLEEARLLILSMPLKPTLVTWGTLLGACRIFKIIDLAELAAKECQKLEPMDSFPYVLLSNLHADLGNWDQVSIIRSMMQEKGIRKDPGRCWIEVGNKIHQFFVGDTYHPEKREIYGTLTSLSEKLKTEGYNPDTRLVLRDMDEEDRENALCSHSERLAIAYGLMHVTPGKPIRIYKNLRICTDCHTFSKLISRITEREIVARDASRFHNFRDGLCSCGDYW